MADNDNTKGQEKTPGRKPGTPLRVVRDGDDAASSRSPGPVGQDDIQPLTAKMLDDFIARLVTFERGALVGDASGQPRSQQTDLTALAAAGARSPLKIKKPGEDSPAGSPAFLPSRKGT